METKDLDGINRDDLFEEIKDKCKSRAKGSIYVTLIILIMAIAYLIYLGQRLYDTKDIVSFILWFIFGCIAIGVDLCNYRFKKKIDTPNTPNQVLSWFKKNLRIEIISGIVAWLILIGDSIVSGPIFTIIETVAAFVVVALLTFYGYGRWNRRDTEIIEQLQELAENK